MNRDSYCSQWLEIHKLLELLEPGDLVEFARTLLKIPAYKHWAMYEGNGWVIHFSGEPNAKSSAQICRAKIVEVAEKSQCRINNQTEIGLKSDSIEAILARARSQIGERGYDVVENNCEHFAHWCRYGRCKSFQSDGGKAMIETCLTGSGLPSMINPMSFTNEHACSRCNSLNKNVAKKMNLKSPGVKQFIGF